MSDDSKDEVRNTIINYLEGIIKGQDVKINRLLEEIVKMKRQLEKCEHDRNRISKWLDILEGIAKKKNKRLEELGDRPSDIPETPFPKGSRGR